MALFNRRNQNQTNVPAEIQEYYQTERRERAGVAWLLAFGTLVVTILLAAGIFFAGRWVYRTAFSNDEPKSTEVAQKDQKQEEQKASNQNKQNSPQPQPQPSSPAPSPSPSPQHSNPAPSPSPSPAPSQSSPAPAPAPAPTPAPQSHTPQPQPQPSPQPSASATAGRNTSIPSTGPGDVVGIFVAVTMAGYLLHRYVIRPSEH